MACPSHLCALVVTLWTLRRLISCRIIITRRPARSAAMPVLFLLSGPKMGFSPHRGEMVTTWLLHVASINVKFGTGAPCQISRLSRQKCGNTAPKTVKISNSGHKFAPQGSLVCPIFTKHLRFCTRLQVDFKFLLWLLSLGIQTTKL